MPAPSWLLLAWSGMAATFVWFGVRAMLRHSPETGSFRRFARDLAIALLVLPPVYGIAFELLGRADLFTGATLGAAHGLLDGWIRAGTFDLTRSRAFIRTALAGLAYGLCIGFLYLVPA